MRRLIAVATAGLLVSGRRLGRLAQDDLLAGVNRHRIALDRRSVRVDPGMMRRSQRHAEQMAEAGICSIASSAFRKGLPGPARRSGPAGASGPSSGRGSIPRNTGGSSSTGHRSAAPGLPVAEAGCGSLSRSQSLASSPHARTTAAPVLEVGDQLCALSMPTDTARASGPPRSRSATRRRCGTSC